MSGAACTMRCGTGREDEQLLFFAQPAYGTVQTTPILNGVGEGNGMDVGRRWQSCHSLAAIRSTTHTTK